MLSLFFLLKNPLIIESKFLNSLVLNDNNKEKEIKLSSGSFKSAKIIETYENTYWKERESQDASAFTVKPKSVTTILLTK